MPGSSPGMTAEKMAMAKDRYSRGEIGRVHVVDDFLPPPDALVPREDHVKVRLSLSKRSLDDFKREAKKPKA
jgi:hypothetical protein